MKTLAIRYWLLLALAVFIVAAALPFPLVARYFCSGEDVPPQQVLGLSSLLSVDVARWSDPAWQSQLTAQLPAGLSVVLRDANRELLRTGPTVTDPTRPTHVVVMNGAQLLGVADIFDVTPCGGQIYVSLAIPLSLLTQLAVALGIIWLLNRYLLRPLAAMSRAARQVAAGNLDFQLPPSRVREVAEVAAAFDAMGGALQTSIGRQAELEQERRFFISAIAHDLRTPLFALRGYLEGLERGLASTPEKAAHYVAVCQEKADQLERLITDLFAYSRLEYLEQAPQREAVDFGQLVNKALDDIRLPAEARHITLSASGPSAPRPVQGDGALLSRALGNLLDNALRYTPNGGTIHITWRASDGPLTFTVADSGPGIEPRDLPNLFTPLFRSDVSRNRETGGAGLGLTIARRILRAHGGDLTAANRAGSGAEFTGSLLE